MHYSMPGGGDEIVHGNTIILTPSFELILEKVSGTTLEWRY